VALSEGYTVHKLIVKLVFTSQDFYYQVFQQSNKNVHEKRQQFTHAQTRICELLRCSVTHDFFFLYSENKITVKLSYTTIICIAYQDK
jgi:hypothetical protein